MCRIFACRNGAAEEMPSLWQGLVYGCPSLAQKKKNVVAFTGSGGKTTWIYRLAEELRRQGKRVAIATTTHMYEPPPELLAADAETAKSLLEGRGFAVVGRRDGRGKIGYGGDALFAVCQALADVVLVEADGSRRQPLKCFGPHEPVISPRTDCIVHVAGLSALGCPLDEVCFRWERSGVDRRQVVTDDVFAAVVSSCLAALRRNWKVPVVPVFNQADGEAVRLRGQDLLRRMAEPIGLTTFFDIEEREDIRCTSL